MESSAVDLPDIRPPALPMCKDCANLIGRRDLLDTSKDWKCGAPQNIGTPNLVDGTPTFKSNESCTAQRYSLLDINMKLRFDICGMEGKWFVKYNQPSPYTAIPVNLGAKELSTRVKVGNKFLDLGL